MGVMTTQCVSASCHAVYQLEKDIICTDRQADTQTYILLTVIHHTNPDNGNKAGLHYIAF